MEQIAGVRVNLAHTPEEISLGIAKALALPSSLEEIEIQSAKLAEFEKTLVRLEGILDEVVGEVN